MSNSMYRFVLGVAVWLIFISSANGQQATEVYIPIGVSPGVSGSETRTGVIRQVDYDTHSMEIQIGAELRRVKVDEKTRYYLDRSKQRRKNSTGTLMDCEKGRTIEVKAAGDEAAEWIKVDTG